MSEKKKSSSSDKAKKAVRRQAKRQAKKTVKKHKKGMIIFVIVLLVVIIAAVAIVYAVKPQVVTDLFNKGKKTVNEYLESTKLYYNDSSDDDNETYQARVSEPVADGDLSEISTSEFSIHFLELGNKYTGDSTLIKCGNTEVLIDAGSRQSSATTITEYVNQYCTDATLEYVVATHAHQDHIAGFVGKSDGNGSQTGVLYQYKVGTLIQFARHNSTAAIYNSYVKAVSYAEEQGATVYTALQCWNGSDGASRSYDLSEAQDGSLTLNVLYNYYYENDTDDENDYSVCVLLTYKQGDTEKNYLFTGDLEGNGESYLVDNNKLPEVELFKGAHHGSKTSSTDKLLSVIKPKNVAVCCCSGSTEYTSNNDNTFPTQAFIDRISVYTDNVYCTTLCTDYKNGTFTSMNGNIIFYVSGDELKLWCSNNTTKLKDTEWFKSNRTTPSAWAS